MPCFAAASARKAASHEDCVPRRRPGGALFRDQHEAARRRARHHRVRAQPAGRYVWLGRGVLRRDIRQHHRQRSGQRRDDPRPFRLLGRHRGALSRSARSYRAATAFPASRARSCSCCCRSARSALGVKLGFSDRNRERRRTRRKLRSRRRGGWAEFQGRAPNSRIISSPPSTRARTNSFGSAPIRNSTTPSLSSSKKPSTAGSGRTPTSSTPTPRRSSSNAPRRPGRNSASAR